MTQPTPTQWSRFSALRLRLEPLADDDRRKALHAVRSENPDDAGVVSLLALHFAMPETTKGIGSGDRIDDFVLGERLGAGAMGVVYEATQSLGEASRSVAIKLINPLLWGMAPEQIRERFADEVKTQAALQYNGLARLYTAGTYEDPATHTEAPYLVMELVHGAQPITDFARERSLDVDEKLRLFQRICRSLQHAHDHRIIHRDLKPDNLLIDSEGRPFVVDFGLAQTADAVLPGAKMVTSGTIAYMSPEQLSPDFGPISEKTDTYALGVVLYELLTGSKPYKTSLKDSLEQLTQVITTELPKRPGGDVSAELVNIVLKALSKKPADRPSVGTLGSQLAHYMEHPLPSLDSAIASVAVLPFDDLSADNDQTHFADGIAFELHSTLSKLHRVRVASRKSSFAFRDDDKDIKEIARKLNVRYILSGSVQYLDDRFRVIAELDNAQEGVQIWSHTYLRDIENIFDLEAEIAQAIVGAFGGQRLRAEIVRAAQVPTKNLDAWGRVQKARSYLLKYNKDSFEQATSLLKSAVELDPDYAAAQAMLGSILAERNLYGLSDDPEGDRIASTAAITRAQELDSDDAFVLKMAGVVLAYGGQHSESITVLRRAVHLAPYDFGAWGYFGWPLVSTGLKEDLVELHAILDRLLEMAPCHPGAAYWLYHKSVAYSCQSNSTKALEFARRSIDEHPDYSLAWMQCANTLGWDSQIAAAADAATRSTQLNKAMTVEHYEKIVGAMSDNDTVSESRVGGLRRAGLLES